MSLSREALLRTRPEGGFFFDKTWHFSPQPLILPPSEVETLEKLGVWLAAFQKAANLLYRRSVNGTAPEWIARWLDRGKPDDLIAISRAGWQADNLPSIIRPDLIWTDDGFALTEIDTLPGGTGITAWMQQIYAEASAQTSGIRLVGDPDMAEILRSRFAHHHILVSKEAADYRPEFDWLYGSNHVRSAEDYQFNNTPIYRFFESFDWPALSSLRDSFTPSVSMDAPLKPFLEEKLWLALFWLKPLESFWRSELGERYFRELRRIIPRTWVLEPAELPPVAVIPELDIHDWRELKDFSQSQRDLVLKISGFSPLAWGSRGVTVGSDVPSDEWARCVDEALTGSDRHPYILQPFRKGRLVQHPFWPNADQEDVLAQIEGRVRLCPYYLREGKRVRLLGVQATICPADKKLIHGMSDAVIVPVAAA